MISDLDLCLLCNKTYSSSASLPIPKSGVYVCTTQVRDGIVVAFRGSITEQDWLRDGETIPRQARNHPQLGYCHDGFLSAGESIVNEVVKAVGNQPLIITGHSLGGAEAVAVGALLTLMKKPIAKIVTFGAPRVGMWEFVKVMNAVRALRQYRRGNDPVPMVPFFIPIIFRYRNTRDPLIQIGKDQPNAFDAHHITGYVEDMHSTTN